MAHYARIARFSLAALPAALLLACDRGGSDEAAESAGGADAALSGALGDQIMVDPDLAAQNGANSAIGANSGDGSLPPELRSPEAIARARAAAAALVGGADKLKKAPAPLSVADSQPAQAALTAAARAAAAPGGKGNCADKAEYTMQWAAKLPAAFPVYPQGSVQEAAGTDAGACSLRVVNYVTPIPLGEVIDFYYTRAGNAGFTAQRVREGADDVLGGAKGDASYVVYARKLPSGSTEVDLITSGK